MNITNKLEGDTYSPSEFNEFMNEIQNFIDASDQTRANNSNQLKQGISRYAAVGNAYAESGAADAYVLTAPSPRESVTVYEAGAIFRFTTSNTNTGASTLNVNGIGAKSIKKNGFTTDLVAGDILAGTIYEVYYDASFDVFQLINLQYKKSVVIETGSNANGQYRLWSDGFKEQWGYTATVTAGSNVTQTFPIAFANAATVTVNVTKSLNVTVDVGGPTADNITTTTVRIGNPYVTGTTGDNTIIGFYASGY